MEVQKEAQPSKKKQRRKQQKQPKQQRRDSSSRQQEGHVKERRDRAKKHPKASQGSRVPTPSQDETRALEQRKLQEMCIELARKTKEAEAYKRDLELFKEEVARLRPSVKSGQRTKKLLVLDLNGLLLVRFKKGDKSKPKHECDFKLHGYSVFLRPGVKEFTEFCFKHFRVAVWSSALAKNTMPLTRQVFGSRFDELLFVWHQEQCRRGNTGDLAEADLTGRNPHRPVFFKVLADIFAEPLHKALCAIDNILLIDDNCYKGKLNLKHTMINPEEYQAQPGDQTLWRLIDYLDGMARSNMTVHEYVQNHPFPSHAKLPVIQPTSPSDSEPVQPVSAPPSTPPSTPPSKPSSTPLSPIQPPISLSLQGLNVASDPWQPSPECLDHVT